MDTTTKTPQIGDTRVVGRAVRKPPAYGYRDWTEERWNVLQVYKGRFGRFFPRWVDVETEEIPGHVSISVGCFGDTGGWLSRFAGLPNTPFVDLRKAR